jgi:hypothetical protein
MKNTDVQRASNYARHYSHYGPLIRDAVKNAYLNAIESQRKMDARIVENSCPDTEKYCQRGFWLSRAAQAIRDGEGVMHVDD